MSYGSGGTQLYSLDYPGNKIGDFFFLRHLLTSQNNMIWLAGTQKTTFLDRSKIIAPTTNK